MTTLSGSEVFVIDSSGWLEYITADSKADLFAHYFEGELTILVPTVILYEVRKLLLLRDRKTEADIFVSEVFRREIRTFDESMALAAIHVSLQHKLAMADAIIYATAQAHRAELITSDAHFSGLPGVTLI